MIYRIQTMWTSVHSTQPIWLVKSIRSGGWAVKGLLSYWRAPQLHSSFRVCKYPRWTCSRHCLLSFGPVLLSCPALLCSALPRPVPPRPALPCTVLFNRHRLNFDIVCHGPPLLLPFLCSFLRCLTHFSSPSPFPILSSMSILHIEFMTYSATLMDYLSVLEQRLFSEGLYEIGGKMRPTQLLGYLDAVYGERSDKTSLDDISLIVKRNWWTWMIWNAMIMSTRVYPHCPLQSHFILFLTLQCLLLNILLQHAESLHSRSSHTK